MRLFSFLVRDAALPFVPPMACDCPAHSEFALLEHDQTRDSRMLDLYAAGFIRSCMLRHDRL